MTTNWIQNQSNQWRGYILFKADEWTNHKSKEIDDNQSWFDYIVSFIY